jgi:hypothetical protein
MNMIDWMKASGEWMHRDRPDLFPTPTDGLLRLEEWVNTIRNMGENGSIETGGFVLVFREDDGVEEWMLNKKISTYEAYLDENVSNAYHWVENSGTMTVAPALPSVTQLEFDLGLDTDDDT